MPSSADNETGDSDQWFPVQDAFGVSAGMAQFKQVHAAGGAGSVTGIAPSGKPSCVEILEPPPLNSKFAFQPNPNSKSQLGYCSNFKGLAVEKAFRENIGESGIRFIFSEEADRTLAAINQWRLEDPLIGDFREKYFDPRNKNDNWKQITIDGSGIIKGLWLPCQLTPPSFQVYNQPISRVKRISEIHVHATNDPHLLLVQAIPSDHSEPIRMIIGPYCYLYDARSQ